MTTSKFTYNQLQTGTKYRLRKHVNAIGFKVNGVICKSINLAVNEIYKMSFQDNPHDYQLALKKEKQSKVSLSKIKNKYTATGMLNEVLGTHKIQGYMVDVIIIDFGWITSSLVFKVLDNGTYVSSLYGVGEYKPCNTPFTVHQQVSENKLLDYYFEIA